MDTQLKGKVAVVTGSTSGIGKFIAEDLAKNGAKVVISSRKEEQVTKTVEEFKSKKLLCTGIPCNVGHIEDIDKLIDHTIKEFHHIDILINNVGINPVIGPIAETSMSLYDKIMQVNLRAPFYLSQKVYPFMKSKKEGVIINMSSAEGLRPGYGLGVYSISKSSLIMLSKTMAKEWGRDNIRINCVCPGLIKTKFSSFLWSNEKISSKIMEKQPLQRLGTPKDISSLVLLLCSPMGSYSTGSVFTVDGGISI